MKIRIAREEVASILPEADIEGAQDFVIEGIAALRQARAKDLSFLSHRKYEKDLIESQASVILIPSGFSGKPQSEQTFIRVEDPSLALGEICQYVEAKAARTPKPGIHKSAVVDEGVKVDPTASIGPLCVIRQGAHIEAGAVLEGQVFVGENACIGEASRLASHVSIHRECIVGKRCHLHSGVVIGGDGFGYHSSEKGHRKLPQIGNTVIEDDVEIGPNSTVDRARFASTIIGQGTKIDNLVQIGHNCVIGKHCILCAGTGIAGSVTVGNFVTIAGQVGISGHIKIGDGAILMGQAGVSKDVAPKSIVTGTPARPHASQRRIEAVTQRLPELQNRLKELEEAFKNSE